MKAFLSLLILAVAHLTQAALVVAAESCDDCVTNGCIYCRISDTAAKCVCNSTDFPAPSSPSVCAEFDVGTLSTPTILSQAGCDFFKDNLTCEDCTSKSGCVYCESSSDSKTIKSGCLCDFTVSCDDVSSGSYPYYSTDACTLTEDFARLFNHAASFAIGAWIAIIAGSLIGICICIAIFCFFCASNRTRNDHIHAPPPVTTRTVTAINKPPAEELNPTAPNEEYL